MKNELLIKICDENYSNELFQMAKFFEGKGFKVTGVWGGEDGYDDGNLAGFNLDNKDISIYLSVDKSERNDDIELRLGTTLYVFEVVKLIEGLGEFIENIEEKSE